ncbi:MAG: K(+)-transporting ATPase subunit C [Chitinophagaceae bacterium]|nr:K(+)-transporting ATPase subunit C [Oligoflexus sp.]
MKAIFQDIKTSVLAVLLFAILLCGLYPLIVWGASSLLFRDKANGSLIERDAKVIGSELIGQGFSSPWYFQSRPSAAGKGYDAASSSGTNLGPTSQKFIDGVRQNVEAYRKANGLSGDVKIPGDAVTASASGLDPHISSKNAELQSTRVARERKLSFEDVIRLVHENTEGPFLGFIGEPGVNVLKLNLALDKISVH